jgi:N-acetylmuramoyl-L-alanine amidase/putative methionine-R-sulfoxide reductase with GAF domain
MSASPTNASMDLTEHARSLGRAQSHSPESDAVDAVPKSEALQALLAFSALHQQVRERRSRGSEDSPSFPEDDFVLDEVLQLVAERAVATTGADGVAIALAEGDQIVCRASSGSIAPDAGARLNPNSGFSGACFRSGQVIRCDDSENDPRVNVQNARRMQARSMIAVPLAGQRSVLGLLEAFSYDAHAFNDTDVRGMQLLAELILSAMRPEEEDRLAEISRQVAARASRETVEDHHALQADLEGEDVAPEDGTHNSEKAIASAQSPPSTSESGLPGLTVVLAIVLCAIALGFSAWLLIHERLHLSKVNNEMASIAVPQRQKAAVAPQPSAPEIAATDSEDLAVSESPADQTKQKLSVLPLVTGVRHWASGDSSTVVIDLQGQVQYEAHRLTDPERIYFDLHDTALAPGLAGKVMDVGDTLLSRIRIAQPMAGVTRVVLDTNGGSNFSVSMETNPYRLVVEVRAVGTPDKPRAKVDLFAPAPPNSGLTTANAHSSRPSAAGPFFRIVLDAGHGGWDLGTVGRQGLMEKDLVLDVVDRLGKLLRERSGADVTYTRTDDTYVPLERRAEIANQDQADLFVSVHANYSDLPTARGIETYYTNTFSSLNAHSREGDGSYPKLQGVSFAKVDIREKVMESHRFAASVQRALYNSLAPKSPGIRNRGVKEASYVVLTGTTMPAILAEISFVSSPADEQKLESSEYREQIAEGLCKGITRYISATRGVKAASTSGKSSGQ